MPKTSIPDLVNNTKISLNVQSENKKDVLKQLIQLFEIDEEQKDLLYNSVLQREEMGSTGIGKGIAIPHTRSMVVTDIMIAIGRLDKPLDFNSIDGKPVRLIFLIVAPPYGSNREYLILLGKIAEIFQEISLDEIIFTTTDVECFKDELCKLFAHKDE